MASEAARRVAKGLRTQKIIDSQFSRLIPTTPKIEFALIVSQRARLELQELIKGLKEPTIQAAIMATMGEIALERIRKRILSGEAGPPVSMVTLEILRIRHQARQYFGLPSGFSPGRVPLHRPFRKGKGGNLLDSIIFSRAGAGSSRGLSGQVFVGIPGNVKSKDTGRPMAAIAAKMETGYEIELTPKMKQFFGRLFAKKGQPKKERKGTGGGRLIVPPRPILTAVSDLFSGKAALADIRKTQDKIEDAALKDIRKRMPRVGKKINKGGAKPFNRPIPPDPQLEADARAFGAGRTPSVGIFGGGLGLARGIMRRAISGIRGFFSR